MSIHDYSPETLRGIIALCVQERADQIVREYSPTSLEVSLDDVATVIDNDYRNYDKMFEVMDMYFDDWANDVAKAMGVEA